MGRLKSFALIPRRAPKQIIDPIVSVIARTGLTPNHISTIGFSGNVGAAVLAARGEFLWAGAVMLVFSAMDMLDGALARATGKATKFGAVFDATLDRMSEAALLGGLSFYFVERGQTEETILCVAALAASLLVSYVRAHALSQGLNIQDGLFTRAVRVILLAGVLMIDQVRIGLWILAVLTSATVVQRVYIAWERLPNEALSDEVGEEQDS
jgi:CDP-diacylglycerol--glycerol-3-phosphate 3-phosphatidyltransferase